jgi:hypothetical protein
LNKHVESHKAKAFLKCSICEEPYKNGLKLLAHFETHFNEEQNQPKQTFIVEKIIESKIEKGDENEDL